MKADERLRVDMVLAAFISLSPVVIWQIEPSAVQCTSGYRGERPGKVMFWRLSVKIW